jgi:hypothetical protein
MSVNNVLKILIGVVILLVGVWMMVNPAWYGQNGWVYGLNWWIYTLDIIKGALGPVLILTGIIVVWISKM